MGVSHGVEVVDQGVQARLVQDRAADPFGMPHQQAERESAAAARAEDPRGTDTERIQQRRRVVSLLLRPRSFPSRPGRDSGRCRAGHR
jgi:hypothetical protein